MEDRAFNDRRYVINSEALKQLGWKEEVSWEDGLRMTMEWYVQHTGSRYKDVESALVPHPSSRPSGHGVGGVAGGEHQAHW